MWAGSRGEGGRGRGLAKTNCTNGQLAAAAAITLQKPVKHRVSIWKMKIESLATSPSSKVATSHVAHRTSRRFLVKWPVEASRM